MGFGVIIATGQKNTILSDKLLESIAEVRVEQFLDEPTQFAIRFQEDIDKGQPCLMDSRDLQYDQIITIAVQVGDSMKCLVRGPITEMESSFQLGGPGSWYQIYGQDRRAFMDREIHYRAWTGEAVQNANSLLEAYQFKVGKRDQAGPAYGGKRENQQQTASTLNQRESDLAFVHKLTRSCGLHFWLEYTCKPSRLDTSGQSLEVKENPYLDYSPPRPQGAKENPYLDDSPSGPQGARPRPTPVEQIKLAPTVDLELRVNAVKQQGPNVTAFSLTVNPERPNRFKGAAIDDRSVKSRSLAPQDEQPSMVKGGRRLTGDQTVEDVQNARDLSITTAGSPEELQRKAQAALTEAGWFVRATASTTAHLLCGVLVPHDVVEVDGLGTVHSGPYQVEAVTHVITAADHFMDIQLRRNALGKR